jgi:hypothetical protein
MPPIDINQIRPDKGISITIALFSVIGGDPEKVKKSQRDRFKDEGLVDKVLEIDNEWRKCIPHLS